MGLAQSLFRIIFLIFFLGGIGLSLFYERKAKIAPVPTLPWVKRKILASLQDVLVQDKAYKIAELGSGWGGLVLSLGRTFPSSSMTGFEISPFPFWVSVLRTWRLRKRITLYRKDFFQEDLSDFDVVVCYLSPYHMSRLREEFSRLKKGSVIVSNAFEVPGWIPYKTQTTHVGISIPIFTYVIQ